MFKYTIYHIAGKFGGEVNLEIQRFGGWVAKLKLAKI